MDDALVFLFLDGLCQKIPALAAGELDGGLSGGIYCEETIL